MAATAPRTSTENVRKAMKGSAVITAMAIAAPSGLPLDSLVRRRIKSDHVDAWPIAHAQAYVALTRSGKDSRGPQSSH